MEPPSAPPRGGHVPWQGLLLAVSLLTFWNPPTTAQLTVESVPPNAAEGKDVLLRVHNLPGDLLGCNWFRGETVNTSHNILSYVVDTQVTTPGPAHSGRETIYPNGSLLFQRVTLKDTGYYTLQTVTKNAQIEHVTGQIRVFHGRSTTGLPVGSIIGIAVGVLVALALTVALGCLLLHTRTGRVSGWHDLRELWRPASTPRHGPPGSSTSPDSLPSPTTSVPIYQFRWKQHHRSPSVVHHWHCSQGPCRTGTDSGPGLSPAPHKDWKAMIQPAAPYLWFRKQQSKGGTEGSLRKQWPGTETCDTARLLESSPGITTPRHKHLLQD